MSARRLWVLIKGLPSDAALNRAVTHGWTQQDELLATNVEVLSEVGRALIYWLQVNAAGHGRVYKELDPELPAPFIERFEHPGRPSGEVVEADPEAGLPPVLTPEIAREIGLI